MRLVDGDALYAKLQEYEELARNRVWDTESTLPFPTNINPAYTRYLAQLDERTALKHMVADVPTIEQPEIIRCRDCKYNDMPPTAGNAGCILLYGMTNQNGFCSLAERREVSE